MSLLISLFWLLSIDGLFVYLFKKRSEWFFVFSIVSGGLLLFAGGLFNNIKAGYYLSWLFVLLIYVLLAKDVIKKDKKNLKLFFDNYLTIGLLIFVIFVVFVNCINRNTGFIFYDEFMHWGPMVKETIRLNSFYCDSESVLSVHKDYPPFFTLVETLWCYFGNKYAESYCYRALNIFMLSLFIPVFLKTEIRSVKDWFSSFAGVIAVILLPFSVYSLSIPSDGFEVYRSIYTDWAMAAFIAFLMYVSFDLENGDFKKIYLSLLLSSLLLMKQICIAFFLLILLCIIVKDYFLEKHRIDLKTIVVYIVIPVLFLAVWKMIINNSGVGADAQFKLEQFKFNEFLNIVNGTHFEEWRHIAFVNYMDNLLHRTMVRCPVSFTYLQYVLLVTIMLVLVLKIKRKRNYSLSLSGIFFFGAIAYAFAMMLLYMFSFDQYEAPVLASFERYIGSYIFTGNCLLLMASIDVFIEIKNVYSKTALVALSVLFCLLISDQSYYKDIIPSDYYDGTAGSEKFLRTKYVLDTFCKGKKVLIVEQYLEDKVYTDRILPYVYGENPSCYYIAKPIGQNTSVEEFLEEASYYDYIYLLYPNDEFIELWNQSTDMYLLRYGLYDIVKTENGIDFEIIGSYENY